jgi:hypothetical protein
MTKTKQAARGRRSKRAPQKGPGADSRDGATELFTEPQPVESGSPRENQTPNGEQQGGYVDETWGGAYRDQGEPGTFEPGNANENATSNRTSEGHWPRGTSGNPAGRPPGSRNKTTLMMQELLESEAGSLVRKAMELAYSGEPHALRICMERLLPPRKERPIQLPLPEVKNGQDALAALACILTATGEGEITPGEARILSEIVEAQKRVIEVENHDRRIAELEKAVQKQKGGQV